MDEDLCSCCLFVFFDLDNIVFEQVELVTFTFDLIFNFGLLNSILCSCLLIVAVKEVDELLFRLIRFNYFGETGH